MAEQKHNKSAPVIIIASCVVVGIAAFLFLTRSRSPKTPPPPALDGVGTTYASLDEFYQRFGIQGNSTGSRGYAMIGRFEHSQWPAKLVRLQETTNQISFALKGGQRNSYPGFQGYRLMLVRLEDPAGGETVVLLRSNDRVVPGETPAQ
jgi:hypothetical protein